MRCTDLPAALNPITTTGLPVRVRCVAASGAAIRI